LSGGRRPLVEATDVVEPVFAIVISPASRDAKFLAGVRDFLVLVAGVDAALPILASLVDAHRISKPRLESM
jgi:hypothetical protein